MTKKRIRPPKITSSAFARTSVVTRPPETRPTATIALLMAMGSSTPKAARRGRRRGRHDRVEGVGRVRGAGGAGGARASACCREGDRGGREGEEARPQPARREARYRIHGARCAPGSGEGQAQGPAVGPV